MSARGLWESARLCPGGHLLGPSAPGAQFYLPPAPRIAPGTAYFIASTFSHHKNNLCPSFLESARYKAEHENHCHSTPELGEHPI